MTQQSNSPPEKAREPKSRSEPEGGGAELELQNYFPYRLARLAEQVSLAVAEVYADRFALTRQEWRILAVLGGQGELSTKEIGRLTTLDKMNVSRAMQSLEARGIVSRSRDPKDGRERLATLTASGRALYRRIVPFALASETSLLSVLTAPEVASLDRIMGKLSKALGNRSATRPD
jgi:DNA-binding MarR family transcriptional regulator